MTKILVRLVSLLSVAFFAALAITIQLSAQDNPQSPPHHHQYQLTQVGTFGGPDSDTVSGPGGSLVKYFNSQGATVGMAATNTADPFYPNCWYDCFVDHALKFENGTLTDLGALPGNTGKNSSASFGIDDSGLIVGVSENGSIDPLTGYPEYHAVVWRHGVLSDLGTLGGSVSLAFAVNDQDQVVGVAANAVPDEYASGLGPCTTWFCSGTTVTTQQRAFLWEGGRLQDLGTLGGNDAAAYLVNAGARIDTLSERIHVSRYGSKIHHRAMLPEIGVSLLVTGEQGGSGQIVGGSCSSPTCSTERAFLWENGSMVDLNTLVTPRSNLHLDYALAIADSGEILAYATLPNGDVRIAVLTPDGDCDSDCEDRIAASESNSAIDARSSQATTTMTSNGPASGKGATGRPNLFGPRQLTPPQHAVPSN